MIKANAMITQFNRFSEPLVHL